MEDIKLADQYYQEAQQSFFDAKKKLTEAESRLIETKINRERAYEQMREFKESDPNVEKTLRDLSIIKFRENHPELVEEIIKRDQNK